MEDLGLRDNEILLVQMASTLRISTAPEPLSDNCVHKDATRGTTTSDGGSEAEDEILDLDIAFKRMFKFNPSYVIKCHQDSH